VFVFELDGTLVDSVYQHVLAWQEALDDCGIDLSVWRIHRRIGMSGGLFAGALLRETGQPVDAALVTQLQQAHAEAYRRRASQVRLLPGARELATDGGGWRQINRAGHPMMWPIFWPDDTDFAHPANTRHPSADRNADGKYIGDRVDAVVAASRTSADPQGYGQTVARDLFPDLLPYVVGTPATYGFAARNGRTLADNAPEVMLSLVANTAVPSGLRPSVAERLRSGRFPYVVPA
jgi:hypothetical protein